MVMCGGTQLCELAIGACATMDPVGTCMSKPTSCDPTISAVCGCDGNSYANDCQRQAAGVSKWANGSCSAPTCPPMAPQPGNSCTQGNISCVYAITTGPDAGCVERLSCVNGIWSSAAVVCPS
jgi:hypothetical protein